MNAGPKLVREILSTLSTCEYAIEMLREIAKGHGANTACGVGSLESIKFVRTKLKNLILAERRRKKGKLC